MWTDCPACEVFYPSFSPPTVKYAKVYDAVVRCFHSASSRSLHGSKGRIEPNINSANHLGCNVHVIIFQVNNFNITLELRSETVNLFDKLFSGYISGTVSYTHLRAHETDSYLVC